MATPPGGIPRFLTAFVGRDGELAAVSALVSAPGSVTLTGPGGCGKTRLAVEVAASAASGGLTARFVDLSTLTRGADVAGAIAAAVGVDRDAASPDAIASRLGVGRQMLIVDNCEHVVDDAASLVDALCRACPELTVMATSRTPLRVDGERVWTVPSLDDANAVALFRERARLVTPRRSLGDVDTIARICRRLDGIPLAIELAAARTATMSVAEVSAGLLDGFALLSIGPRTVPPRHRTMAACLRWSSELLNDEERDVLARLSVFAGAFDRAAAIAVGGDDRADVLDRLVLVSLVQAERTTDTTSYRLLGTVRDHAAAGLDHRAETAARDRHLAYYLDVAEAAAQSNRLDVLGTWYPELRAALEWAAAAGQTSALVRLIEALARAWRERGHVEQPRPWVEAALAEPDRLAREQRAVLLASLALMEVMAGEPERARQHGDAALSAARNADDQEVLGAVLVMLSRVKVGTDDLAAGTDMLTEALDLDTITGQLEADGLAQMAAISLCEGDLPRARQLAERAVAAGSADGPGFGRGIATCALLWVRVWEGDPDVETDTFAALEDARQRNDDFIRAGVRWMLAWLAGLRHDGERARVHARDAAMAVELTGLTILRVLCRYFEAAALYAAGDLDGARVAAQQAVDDSDMLPPMRNFCVATLADVHHALGDRTAAEVAAREVMNGTVRYTAALGRRTLARVARSAGQLAPAEADLHVALAACHELGFVPDVLETLEDLAGIAADEDSAAEAARLLGAVERGRAALQRPCAAPLLTSRNEDRARVEAALGAEAFATALAEGMAMSVDEAVAYASRGRGERRRPTTGWAALTPAERDVARLVADGLTNGEVAARLFVSVNTVKTHLGHVFDKLGIANRRELIKDHPPG